MKVGSTDSAQRLWCIYANACYPHSDSDPDTQVLFFVSFDLVGSDFKLNRRGVMTWPTFRILVPSSSSGLEILEIGINVSKGHGKDLFSSDVRWSTLDHQLLTSQTFVSLRKVALMLASRDGDDLLFWFSPGWIKKVKAGAVNFSADIQCCRLQTQVIGSNPVKKPWTSFSGHVETCQRIWIRIRSGNN